MFLLICETHVEAAPNNSNNELLRAGTNSDHDEISYSIYFS